MAARAIVFAADHPKRREYWVGSSTVATMIGNSLAPGILDWYLSKTGFSSQQTGDPKPKDQADNLFEPADGPDGKDFGARGLFSDRSKSRSVQQWFAHRYPQLAAVGGAVVVAGGVLGVALARR